MRRKKIGLALGGGAARGLAHIGVLDILQKEGIPIDMVAGTSAGAIVGALYAQGKDAGQIKSLALEFGSRKLASFVDPYLPKSGFIRGKKIHDLLVSYIGDVRFSDMKIPFVCVATDIETGEEVVINQGSVPEAVRASISIPGIFAVTRWEGRYLVDGGVVNPVPVNVLKQIGASFIIAVNVIPEVSMGIKQLAEKQNNNMRGPDTIHKVSDKIQRFIKEERDYLEKFDIVHKASEKVQQSTEEYRDSLREPNIIHVLMQSLNIGMYLIAKTSLEYADVIIAPQVAHIGADDFHNVSECIKQGALAAREAITEIKRILALE
ncbi:patatin-like phospholipase family protein [Chloroflexota bacterium]